VQLQQFGVKGKSPADQMVVHIVITVP
jgi:hypothetical protein